MTTSTSLRSSLTQVGPAILILRSAASVESRTDLLTVLPFTVPLLGVTLLGVTTTIGVRRERGVSFLPRFATISRWRLGRADCALTNSEGEIACGN
jgi:hypothetical protein